MKWVKIIIDILGWVLPVVAAKGKANLTQELEIAKKAIVLLSKDISAEAKGQIVTEAVGNLKAVQGFKKRINKKLDKAKDRLYKKLF